MCGELVNLLILFDEISTLQASSRQTRLRSNKYNDNITKRGNVPIGVAERREQGYSVGPILLGFLVFVVCGR